ncbi:MAG: hypothetical protein AB8G05_27100 [Oligoflexales bacterium]
MRSYVFFMLVLASSECFAMPSLIGIRISSIFPLISKVNLKRNGRILPFRNQLRFAQTSNQSGQASAWDKVLKGAEFSAPDKALLGKLQPVGLTFLAPVIPLSVSRSVSRDIIHILDISKSESAFVYNLVKDHYSLDFEQKSYKCSDMFLWFENLGPYVLKVDIEEQIVISEEYDEVSESWKQMETYIEAHSVVIEKTASGKFHFYQAVKGELTLFEFMNNAELNDIYSGNIEGMNKKYYTEDEVRIILDVYSGLKLNATMSSSFPLKFGLGS